MAGGGAGLVQDMVKTINKNKSLLKKASGTYASFDHTSYSLPKNCKEPTFKEATPEVLATIREQMISQKSRSTRIMTLIFIAAILGGITCLAIILFMKF